MHKIVDNLLLNLMVGQRGHLVHGKTIHFKWWTPGDEFYNPFHTQGSFFGLSINTTLGAGGTVGQARQKGSVQYKVLWAG